MFTAESRKNHMFISRTKVRKKGILNYIRNDLILYLMLIIPIAYFVIFKYLPMYGIVIAFKDYNIFKGIMGSEWIGLEVFKQIFSSDQFYQVVRNTLLLNFLDLLVGFPAPIILALLLNELKVQWFKRTAQSLLYIPHFLSWVIIGGMVLQVFAPGNGTVNSILKNFGLQSVPFLTDPLHWIIVYVLVGVWQNMGWGTIIYLAGISGISGELYEAAECDGAGRLRRIWNITLPGLRPTIIVLLILSISRITTISFDRPFILGNPFIYDYGDVISTYVYRIGITYGNFNVATAVGLFQSVVGVVFLAGTNFIANRFDESGIW